ncbi:MAG: hypothetical protein LBI57_07605 [Helicobacteraceae bacterium]|jgi:hypothetical protein|nr:hypothetical protein [Helicobacteraceae bacterium]
MKGRTILQRIADALEAAGISVSGIETWAMVDGRVIPVSLRVHFPHIENEAVIDFIENYIIFDNSACEDVSGLYQAYIQTVDEGNFCVGRKKFMRIVKKYFPECKIRGTHKPDGKIALIFSGIRFNAPMETETVKSSCDRQKAEEARIRKEAESEAIDRVESVLDTINANKSPDDPPAVRDPCGECANPDCFYCSLKDGTPIKLYDPKEAAAAMMAGRVLQNEKKEKCFWENDGFRYEAKTGMRFVLADLSGLYEEARYV